MFQTFTPREYLKIDIANNYGHDKLDWDDRISWFDQHETQLRELVASADEPALFFAGVLAWEKVQQGLPIGYMVSLDATSSGLQLLAALTGDRKAASLCNVIDAGHRADAYTGIYDQMVGEIGETSKITRDQCKEGIMTSLYGSTAMPKKIFGEGALLDMFYKTMKENAPAAWELNEAFLAVWDPTVDMHSWTLPDNFHVHVKVMDQEKETIHFLNQPFDVFYNVNRPTEEGRSLGANCIHSIDGMIVRELTRRCNYNPNQVKLIRDMLESHITWGTSEVSEDDKLVCTLWDHYESTGYLSARILDVLNAENLGHVDPDILRALLDSLPDKPFKVVSIHDCFRCLPTYGNDLRRQYNIQLQLIAQSDLLSVLLGQIIGKPGRVHIGKLDPDLHIEIIDTNYALS
jgi:hypothetical protein